MCALICIPSSKVRVHNEISQQSATLHVLPSSSATREEQTIWLSTLELEITCCFTKCCNPGLWYTWGWNQAGQVIIVLLARTSIKGLVLIAGVLFHGSGMLCGLIADL